MSFVCILTPKTPNDNNDIEFFHFGNMELINKQFAPGNGLEASRNYVK